MNNYYWGLLLPSVSSGSCNPSEPSMLETGPAIPFCAEYDLSTFCSKFRSMSTGLSLSSVSPSPPLAAELRPLQTKSGQESSEITGKLDSGGGRGARVDFSWGHRVGNTRAAGRTRRRRRWRSWLGWWYLKKKYGQDIGEGAFSNKKGSF